MRERARESERGRERGDLLEVTGIESWVGYDVIA